MTLPAAMSALAEALLHSLWQGAAIGGLAWLLCRVVLRRRTASTRFAVMHAAVWLVVVACMWTWAGAWAAQARAITFAPISEMRPAPRTDLLPWIVLAAWATGAAWHATRLGLGLIGIARWRRDAVALDAAWHHALASLRESMGVTQRVDIGAKAGLEAPIVFGVWRPLVLVPLSWAAGVPTTVMRAALAHELAHVSRHDYALQLAVQVIDAMFHFHPAVRWMTRELGVLRELACDELVVARAIDSFDYAHALTELELARVVPEPVLAANGAPLVQRIEHLVTHDPSAVLAPRRAPLVTAVVAALLAATPAVVVVACQPGTELTADPDTASESSSAGVTAEREATRAPELAANPVIAVPWLRDALGNHASAIDAAARRHGVDPSLLAIVTWVESHGDPNAKSPMGARGLMQLMPATAAQIAKARGISDHSVRRLDDPTYNLDLGAYHLAELIQTYGGGDELDADVIGIAAAAYNGGSRTAEAWLGGAALPDETARYREIVVAMWQARNDAEAPRIE